MGLEGKVEEGVCRTERSIGPERVTRPAPLSCGVWHTRVPPPNDTTVASVLVVTPPVTRSIRQYTQPEPEQVASFGKKSPFRVTFTSVPPRSGPAQGKTVTCYTVTCCDQVFCTALSELYRSALQRSRRSGVVHR